MSIQFRTHENGNVCCCSHAPNGERIAPKYPCEKCKQHFATLGLRTAEAHDDNSYDPPNPYDALPTLRAASGEDAWKADRLRTLQLEYAAWDADDAAHPAPRTLSADDLAPYVAPNPYLKKEAR